MFLTRRLINRLHNVPTLPYAITTIFQADMEGHIPSNGRCLIPATVMYGISTMTQWSPLNTYLTWGLLGTGVVYHLVRSAADSMIVKQIDANQDFSLLYVHFNGGWLANYNLKKAALNQDIQYNPETKVLTIPTSRACLCNTAQDGQNNLSEACLSLSFNNAYQPYDLPINLEKNLVLGYRNHWKQLSEQTHGNRPSL